MMRALCVCVCKATTKHKQDCWYSKVGGNRQWKQAIWMKQAASRDTGIKPGPALRPQEELKSPTEAYKESRSLPQESRHLTKIRYSLQKRDHSKGECSLEAARRHRHRHPKKVRSINHCESQGGLCCGLGLPGNQKALASLPSRRPSS